MQTMMLARGLQHSVRNGLCQSASSSTLAYRPFAAARLVLSNPFVAVPAAGAIRGQSVRTFKTDAIVHDNYPSRYTEPTHREPESVGDKLALWSVKALRVPMDLFFAKRYGHRAVVLETIAAVPGLVAGALIHLRCLRKMQDDKRWINQLLEESENERMHLMTFMAVAKPSLLERLFVLIAQGVVFNAYFLAYLVSPRACHRFVGYLEEEACKSYTSYLAEIDAGHIPNGPAPEVAIRYWNLNPQTATLRDVVVAVRDDEAQHRDLNHEFSNKIVIPGESPF